MTWILANCFDGVSNGTGITTGNSGVASGAAFDGTTTGTGATITADTSIVAHPFPGASAKFVTGGTAALCYANWGTSFTSSTTVYFRIYGYVAANPSAAVLAVRFGSSAGSGFAGGFQINPAGTISFIDTNNVVQLTSTHTIPLGSWWRLEGFITGAATTGKAEFKCYFTSPDGSTPNETQTSPATLSTAGIVTSVRLGISNSVASITLHLDDALVTDIGYMGPSVASPACRVGASVFNGTYGSTDLTRAAGWDAILGRDMASGPNGVQRRYYSEGTLPATSGADTQNVVALTQAGIKVVLSFHPWRDSTNAYSGTISGKGITYAQELAALQTTLLMYFSNGVQPSQLEFALWHEENGHGYHGDFGDGTQSSGPAPPNGAYSATTNAQAAANYAAYFTFYAPAFSALGLKLTYIPAVYSPNDITTFFPGNVTASLTAYHNAIMTDYYWTDYNSSPSTKTLSTSLSVATTFKLKQGIGEWGFIDGTGTGPNASQFNSWSTGTATPPGELLAPLLSFRANGGTVGDVIWFNGTGGSNNITSSTDPTIIASVQKVYDQLTASTPPTPPAAALFPIVPGISVPGGMSPADPGSLSAPPPPPVAGTLVNHWIGDLINAPGLCQAAVNGANVSDNSLVCFVGWNDSTFPAAGTVSVTDDAHNFWYPLSFNTQTSTSLRGAIWIADAAEPCQVVCVSASLPVSSMAVLVCELSGLPQLSQLDIASSAMTTGTTSSITETVNADWAFSLLVSGNNTDTISTSGGYSTLPTVAINDPSGAGGPGDITLTPMLLQTSGGSTTPGYSSTGSQPLAQTFGAILQAFTPVGNALNPAWPIFQVQAAFGAQVGAGTANLTWTDITSRAIHPDGTILDVQKGRSYELSGPESGTIQLWLNNQDGALTPGNASSPYYPNVLPQTPVKVTATWNNVVYNVAYGYMDKWPQSFDMPQWGFVNAQASDAMGVLANLSMFSALQSEVLFDNPYAYWPLNDSYGVANGLPFTNLGSGISNTKPMIGLDATSTGSNPLSTGLALNLQGDTGTGIGLSGLTANPSFYSSGAICEDPGLPQLGPSSAISMAVEFWAQMPASAPSGGSFETPLVSLHGPATNYGSGGGSARLRIEAQSASLTNYLLMVKLSDSLTNVVSSGLAFTLPNDGNTHHHFFNIKNVSGTWSISHYLDGVFDFTFTSSATLNMAGDIYLAALGPCQITPLTQNPYNYTIGHVALYKNTLNPQRILAHYQAGARGFQNDTDNNRFARIMAWSGTHVPNAALGYAPAPLMGPAFSLASQAATDAINDLIVSTGGFPYADGSGTVWWVPRTALYNRTPKWVLSDNPADGGIFYDPGQAFDFDNSFLFIQNTVGRVVNQTNQVTTSKLNGVNSQSFQNTGAIVTLTQPGAQAKYGNRNALAQTILTTSDQDVYDRNNWSLAKYSSSSLRIPKILVDAASNPAQWPFVLGAEQGDVVQVKRSPLGGAPYVVSGVIISTHLEIGMNTGQMTLGIIPYNVEANILQVGVTGADTLNSGIGW